MGRRHEHHVPRGRLYVPVTCRAPRALSLRFPRAAYGSLPTSPDCTFSLVHIQIFIVTAISKLRIRSEKTQPQIRLLCSPWEKIGIAETVKAIVVLSERGYIKMKLSQPLFCQIMWKPQAQSFLHMQTSACSHSCTSPGAEHGCPDEPQISSTSVTNLQANFLLLTIPAR